MMTPEFLYRFFFCFFLLLMHSNSAWEEYKHIGVVINKPPLHVAHQMMWKRNLNWVVFSLDGLKTTSCWWIRLTKQKKGARNRKMYDRAICTETWGVSVWGKEMCREKWGVLINIKGINIFPHTTYCKCLRCLLYLGERGLKRPNEVMRSTVVVVITIHLRNTSRKNKVTPVNYPFFSLATCEWQSKQMREKKMLHELNFKCIGNNLMLKKQTHTHKPCSCHTEW